MAYARQQTVDEQAAVLVPAEVATRAPIRPRQYLIVVALAVVVGVGAGIVLHRQSSDPTPAEIQQIRGQEMADHHQRLWEKEQDRIQAQRADEMVAYYERLWDEGALAGD